MQVAAKNIYCQCISFQFVAKYTQALISLEYIDSYEKTLCTSESNSMFTVHYQP